MEDDLEPIRSEIKKRHDESVRRLQQWIRQPAIAAENRGLSEGCDQMAELLRDSGFQEATRVPTDGHPGVFATLDAGASRTVGLYFMPMSAVDPAEWSSRSWEAARSTSRVWERSSPRRRQSKGPQAALLAACTPFACRRKLPVNLVLFAEGEEETVRLTFRKSCAVRSKGVVAVFASSCPQRRKASTA
jgi:acetylornithine deacetylase/succinyl-diaminopimelate desuccinylase-like protein